MKLLGPTQYPRLNEGMGLVFLSLGIGLGCALVSYHPLDPSWNTATAVVRPVNLIGRAGATASDALLQFAGLGSFLVPLLLIVLAWKWFRSERIEAQFIKVSGSLVLILAVCTAFALGPELHPLGGTITAGGLIGRLMAGYLVSELNPLGAMLLTGSAMILSLYLVSRFSLSLVWKWLEPVRKFIARTLVAWQRWKDKRRDARRERAARRAEEAAHRAAVKPDQKPRPVRAERYAEPAPDLLESTVQRGGSAAPPWDTDPADETIGGETPSLSDDEIPIHALEDYQPAEPGSIAVPEPATPGPSAAPKLPAPKRQKSVFRMPPTELLREPQARPPYDSQELKDIAAKIKSKFEEFNVTGSVTQINPGPVVTTFEYKPEAGVKYSRITNLTEDLCLGLHAESILIERIPGKPTVGIEVPNSRREVISLRQILESDEFRNSTSPLTIALGKDISGRIKVTALETMPHLLIAGSTGSGKSVMLNTMIMSILFKATPDDVRMIMVDPKRVELGIYEGIPHLLTPVITDPRKATNALRNAVLEMERRLKLLASQGVRNIDQFNRKMRQQQAVPRSLFEEATPTAEIPPEPLPYILIIIDELADLMMLERAGVEESVTRLAQMARAVGMHLVLATQRPSVDVITGLIKANFPARISFRVATRVDSRTILDVMGADHLLGKGDMLHLPPGSSRLIRVHGAFVGETEIEQVVENWKEQGGPEYDQSFLLAPPNTDDGEEPAEEFEGEQDPLYQDAVRVVLELGKASTSTLQRRLRLGYGRAARILDVMQREGIIGPPDGPRPREVLKRPDWLEEIDHQMR